MGTHKNKKKKKKVEEIIGNKRSRVGTNRRWLKMTLTDKEKIKKSLQEIHDFKRLYVEQLASFSCENSPRYERLLKEIVKILT